MKKIGFVGFGEVNTPVDVIVRKCTAAKEQLEAEGLELVSVFPVADDYEEKDIKKAVDALAEEKFEALILCIAGWIPTHAVIKVAEHYRHLPVVLWGLCGWYEDDGRLVTTADQAGTTGLRKTLADLGYRFKYVYDIIGKPSGAKKVAQYCRAAVAASELRHVKAGMMMMPRSCSSSMESRICSARWRWSMALHSSSRRSARVDLPWSIWAMMEKLRILESSVIWVAPQ